MNAKVDRKQAIQDYKNRKVARGIFAVRCTATGQVWVDASPNLDAAPNSLSFTLRHGSHRNPALQSASNTHGEQSIKFEVLEKLDDDVSPHAIGDLLKEKKRHWLAELSAQAL